LLSNPIHFSSSFAAQHFHLQDRLGAIEEHSDLGQGFHVAEKDMGIRGFGSLFGEQQSGDVANVGVDLFFDMLFDSLSKVSSFTQTHIY
jgi:transcription-repair coupling factor (superfamily II helicase)